MRTVLRRVDPASLAKVFGVLYAIFGLIAGVLIGLFGGLLASATGGDAGFGFFSIIVFPILYGIGGFIGGFLTAIIYNFIADRVGGVELELDDYGTTDIL